MENTVGPPLRGRQEGPPLRGDPSRLHVVSCAARGAIASLSCILSPQPLLPVNRTFNSVPLRNLYTNRYKLQMKISWDLRAAVAKNCRSFEPFTIAEANAHSELWASWKQGWARLKAYLAQN